MKRRGFLSRLGAAAAASGLVPKEAAAQAPVAVPAPATPELSSLQSDFERLSKEISRTVTQDQWVTWRQELDGYTVKQLTKWLEEGDFGSMARFARSSEETLTVFCDSVTHEQYKLIDELIRRIYACAGVRTS